MIHYTTFPLLIPNFPQCPFLNLNKLHEATIIFFSGKLLSLPLTSVLNVCVQKKGKNTPRPNHLQRNILKCTNTFTFPESILHSKGQSSLLVFETPRECLVALAQKQDVNLMRLQKVSNFLVLRSPF